MSEELPAPLTADEELLWRSLGRVVHAMPRLLDSDMTRACGLTMTDAAMLTTLLEAPGHELRMTELAARTTLSASRITRVVDDLRHRGLVRRAPHASDARGAVAVLTDEGVAAARTARPAYLSSARRRILDHVPPEHVAAFAAALEAIAAGAARPQQRFDPAADGERPAG